MAGARVGADYSQLRDLSAALVEPSRSKLEWTTVQAPDGAPDGLAKVLLNLVALGHEALPRGGRLKVDIASAPGSIEASVTAEGQDVHMRPEALAGLKHNIDLDDMTPPCAHGYLTPLIATRLGSVRVLETCTDERRVVKR